MGFDQYHEPAHELPPETRTFARMIASLTEEAEAIGWYEQRLAVKPNPQARAIMANAQEEEFKHFGMDLEFLLRQKPKWRVALQDILFKEGDIGAHGEEADEAEQDASGSRACVSEQDSLKKEGNTMKAVVWRGERRMAILAWDRSGVASQR